MLSEKEFETLVEAVQMSVYQELECAWKNERLEVYLQGIGMERLIPSHSVRTWEDSLRKGKVIFLGQSEISNREICASISSCGISKGRIEMHIGYKELKRFDFSRLQYNSAYRLILVGSIPHSTRGKGVFSSIINRMEQEEGFTKVVRLMSNDQLKMTKTNIKAAIQQEIESGYLAAG